MATKKTYVPKLNPVLHNLSKVVTEGDKRSNHPDFATTSELKKREWSGVRQNSITEEYEFWVCGEIRATVTKAAVALDYLALDKKHIELFGVSMS